MAKRKILIKNNGKNGSFTIRVRKKRSGNDNSLSDVVVRIVTGKRSKATEPEAA